MADSPLTRSAAEGVNSFPRERFGLVSVAAAHILKAAYSGRWRRVSISSRHVVGHVTGAWAGNRQAATERRVGPARARLRLRGAFGNRQKTIRLRAGQVPVMRKPHGC